MAEQTPPTLYEWAGGMEIFEQLTDIFYRRVKDEPLLASLFEDMAPDHARYVGHFIAEVFGGPSVYSDERGGHANMIMHHIGKRLTPEQRTRWAHLICECADEAGMPDDPEFRSAFVGYIEWGSRLALINSQPGADANPDSPMPVWNWGAVGGPYQG